MFIGVTMLSLVNSVTELFPFSGSGSGMRAVVLNIISSMSCCFNHLFFFLLVPDIGT